MADFRNDPDKKKDVTAIAWDALRQAESRKELATIATIVFGEPMSEGQRRTVVEYLIECAGDFA